MLLILAGLDRQSRQVEADNALIIVHLDGADADTGNNCLIIGLRARPCSLNVFSVVVEYINRFGGLHGDTSPDDRLSTA